MDLERFSALTKSLEDLLREEFIFPVNLAASEPTFIALFSVLLPFVGLLLAICPAISVWSKFGRWSKADLIIMMIAAPILLVGTVNVITLLTTPQSGWRNLERYQGYIELAEFLNQSYRYSRSPFDLNEPSRLEFIELQRSATHEIWKATNDEVTRKLLGKRERLLDL